MMPKKVLIIQSENCVGCHMCELACSSIKEGEFIPERSRIRVITNGLEGWSRPCVCLQCYDAMCIAACEVGAIFKCESANGGAIITVDPEKCIECNQCVEACPFGAIELIKGLGAIKCDLCGGSPACVRFCNYNCLKFLEISEEEYQVLANKIKEFSNKIQNESSKYTSYERRLAFSFDTLNSISISKDKRRKF
jgi:carbon-monoxide dehydrogenase iron sulfur subunit